MFWTCLVLQGNDGVLGSENVQKIDAKFGLVNLL